MGEIALSIIVPTYRERMNITALIQCINDTMQRLNMAYEVIVVDDDSEDGIEFGFVVGHGSSLRLRRHSLDFHLFRRVVNGFISCTIGAEELAIG